VASSSINGGRAFRVTNLTLPFPKLLWARIAGGALLVICLSGLLGNNLAVGDVAGTARNILVHDREFRIGIWGELLMLNADIVLAVAFFALLKPVKGTSNNGVSRQREAA
jgi:hypothetical protein